MASVCGNKRTLEEASFSNDVSSLTDSDSEENLDLGDLQASNREIIAGYGDIEDSLCDDDDDEMTDINDSDFVLDCNVNVSHSPDDTFDYEINAHNKNKKMKRKKVLSSKFWRRAAAPVCMSVFLLFNVWFI